MQKGLRPQSIAPYLAGVRHLLIAAGEAAPNRQEWPRLQLVLRGIKRSQAGLVPQRRRLPITISLMVKIQAELALLPETYAATMLWAACCMAFFGFMRCGEFTVANRTSDPPIKSTDVALDSHTNPSLARAWLRKAKCDPFGKGVCIYLGKSGTTVCPVAAIVNYLVARPREVGPLFVWADGSPLTRDCFVGRIRSILSRVVPNSSDYAGHSFRIGAATSAAVAGIPDNLIKTLGRWQSEAYMLYIRQPGEALAATSRILGSLPPSDNTH